MEVGAQGGQLGLAADRPGPDAAAGRDVVEPGADEGVAGVGPLGDGGQHQAGGRLRREVLGRVDGEVGPPVEDGLLDLLHEHARPADGPDRDVGALVAGRRHDDELDVAAEEGGDPLGLPERQPAAPGGDAQRGHATEPARAYGSRSKRAERASA